MTIMKVDKLTKCYGSFTAVDGISVEVERGELLGFLGVNVPSYLSWAKELIKLFI